MTSRDTEAPVTIPTELAELTELFRKLGAPQPEQWAQSQVREGIPQLMRFLFLRQAWRYAAAEGDAAWIDDAIKRADAEPNAPYADIGRVLGLCRAKGVSKEDLTALARGLQASMLFHIGYLMGAPGLSEPELQGISWGLFATDDDGAPTYEIGMLHESVLETDPTGREMRPKKGMQWN